MFTKHKCASALSMFRSAYGCIQCFAVAHTHAHNTRVILHHHHSLLCMPSNCTSILSVVYSIIDGTERLFQLRTHTSGCFVCLFFFSLVQFFCHFAFCVILLFRLFRRTSESYGLYRNVPCSHRVALLLLTARELPKEIRHQF